MKFIHFDQFEFDSWASEEILSCATANKTQFNTIDKFLSECPSDRYREGMLAYCEEKSWIDYEKMDKTRAPHIKYSRCSGYLSGTFNERRFANGGPRERPTFRLIFPLLVCVVGAGAEVRRL